MWHIFLQHPASKSKQHPMTIRGRHFPFSDPTTKTVPLPWNPRQQGNMITVSQWRLERLIIIAGAVQMEWHQTPGNHVCWCIWYHSTDSAPVITTSPFSSIKALTNLLGCGDNTPKTKCSNILLRFWILNAWAMFTKKEPHHCVSGPIDKL